MYKVKNQETKNYKVISILEYCVKDKWIKVKSTIGTKNEPLTDEQLTEFIEKYNPIEINLLVYDKRGVEHKIDFTVDCFII